MSEHQAEQTQGEAGVESGSVNASPTVPAVSEATSRASAAAALALSVLEAPATAPDHEAPRMEAQKTEAPKVEASKIESPTLEVSKPGAPRGAGKVLIMAPGDRVWRDHSASAKVDSKVEPELKAEKRDGAAAKRGFLATAAMLLFATMAGAIGGAPATTGFTHVADATAAPPPASGALEASIARIDSDILSLKAGLEHTTKVGVTQFNKTSDRLDKIEKAQAEPNAKLAKLTEAFDKLRTAAAAAPAPAPIAAAVAAPKEVTGSITPPPGAAPLPVAAASPAAAAAAPPKVEVARLPTVEGWSLADVGYGGALIRSRRGTIEIYPGDYVPGLGRIDAVRRQDGQWVVVTSKGLITR